MQEERGMVDELSSGPSLAKSGNIPRDTQDLTLEICLGSNEDEQWSHDLSSRNTRNTKH